MRPLIAQLKYRSLKITVNAALQRQFHSPFIFREEDPSRQVSPEEPCRCGEGGWNQTLAHASGVPGSVLSVVGPEAEGTGYFTPEGTGTGVPACVPRLKPEF
jgi:hypothetical protein